MDGGGLKSDACDTDVSHLDKRAASLNAQERGSCAESQWLLSPGMKRQQNVNSFTRNPPAELPPTALIRNTLFNCLNRWINRFPSPYGLPTIFICRLISCFSPLMNSDSGWETVGQWKVPLQWRLIILQHTGSRPAEMQKSTHCREAINR